MVPRRKRYAVTRGNSRASSSAVAGVGSSLWFTRPSSRSPPPVSESDPHQGGSRERKALPRGPGRVTMCGCPPRPPTPPPGRRCPARPPTPPYGHGGSSAPRGSRATAGSGRRTLAAALRERRGWRAVVDDLDVIAAPGAPAAAPPDVEIVCLRTAPCRHEEAWIRRPRAHALLVVATGLDHPDDGEGQVEGGKGGDDDENPAPRPRWAVDLPAVDARCVDDISLDVVIGFLDRALDALPAVRAARLEADLMQVAARGGGGDLAEAALCALDGTALL